ncbi:MAG: hypothetical protein ABW199_01395, partial [Caulobacterales bacterium]
MANAAAADRKAANLIDRGLALIDSFRRFFAPEPYEPTALRPSAVDWVCVGVLSIVAAAIAWIGPTLFVEKVYTSGLGSYFSSDPERVFAVLSDANSVHHHRVLVHPIFSLVTYPPAQLLMAIGLDVVQAGTLLLVIAAVLTAALFYFSLRAMSLSTLGATAFTSSLIASAGFIHWYSFVETFAFSGLTISIMLFVLTAVKSTP